MKMIARRIGKYTGIIALACFGIGGNVYAQEAANPPNFASSSSLGTVGHANPPPIVHGDTTTVNRGNATLEFEPAGTDNIDTANYQIWNEFASDHPEIARAIAYRPKAVDDPAFLRKHPALATFYQQHPEVRDALIADPGNFAAIPPRPGE